MTGVDWPAIATTIGGFAAVGLPSLAWAVRHVKRSWQADAKEAVLTTVGQTRTELHGELSKQNDAMADIQRSSIETNVRLVRLEDEQFGPNHGGMRQSVDEIKAIVQQLVVGQARLEGQLAEHVRAHG